MIRTRKVYITLGVKDETQGLERVCMFVPVGRERRFHREVKKDCRKRNCLINLVEEGGNLINLSGNREFQRLEEHYDYLKRIGYGPQKQKISNVDLRVLLTGLYLVLNGKNTALVSNDGPLMFSWQRVLIAEYLFSQQLGFFFRKDIEEYRKATPKRSEQPIKTSISFVLHGY